MLGLLGFSVWRYWRLRSPGPHEAVLGTPFVVKAGETVTFLDARLQVKLDAVLDDSRCPKNVKCFWEGNARVRFILTLDNAPIPIVLNTSRKIGPREDAIAGSPYRLRLDSLGSEPVDPANEYPKRAIAQLRVLRSSDAGASGDEGE